jgi:hypothetical protein
MTETAGRQGLDLSALSVGQSAEEVRRITPNALVFYTHASGDLNPLHLPEIDGDGDGKPEGICPPAFLASLIHPWSANACPAQDRASAPGVLKPANLSASAMKWRSGCISSPSTRITSRSPPAWTARTVPP